MNAPAMHFHGAPDMHYHGMHYFGLQPLLAHATALVPLLIALVILGGLAALRLARG